MTMNDKNGEIILCSGIKLDKNYENVLSYNEQNMVNLCRNNQIYNGFNYSIMQPNKLRISAKYEDCIYANYMAFINRSYGNKWFFAWVTDVRLLNPSTTEIAFELDVWSTWFSRFNIGKAFIEREHVSDDTVGKHTLPEGLETGEYISQNGNNTTLDPILNNMYYLNNILIIAGVTEVGMGIVLPASSTEYNGVYSGLRYLAFDNAGDLEKYIRNCQEYFSTDNIATLFVAPASLTNIQSSDWINMSVGGDIHYAFKFAFVPATTTEVNMGDIYYTVPDHLDDNYVPVNRKLLTFPYCFLNITNNSGITKDYHYELFNSDDNYCDFTIKGAIGVGCSIKLYPKDYATGNSVSLLNKLHTIDAGKLPTCSWLNDAYTNWLTANSVNIGLGVAENLFNASTGIVTGNIGSTVSGFGGILGTVASVYQHSLQPASAKGGLNQGDLIFAQRNTFNIYPMSIKKEYAIIIDQFFSRFGYKVNEVKTPNLASRQQFNFIKVGGMDEIITGNIPASDLEKINGIFRKGVTIFHNYNNFGNYTINNPIV